MSQSTSKSLLIVLLSVLSLAPTGGFCTGAGCTYLSNARRTSFVGSHKYDEGNARKREKLGALVNVGKISRKSKRIFAILGASLAFLRGPLVEPAQAAIKAPVETVDETDTESRTVAKKVRGIVVVTAGSVVLFKSAKRGKECDESEREGTQEGSDIKIPQRRSLEDLKEMREAKLEKIKQLNGINVEVERLSDAAIESVEESESEREDAQEESVIEDLKETREAKLEKTEQLNGINVEVELSSADAATTELPLSHEFFYETWKAKKLPEEKAKLASKYAAIESVEESESEREDTQEESDIEIPQRRSLEDFKEMEQLNEINAEMEQLNEINVEIERLADAAIESVEESESGREDAQEESDIEIPEKRSLEDLKKTREAKLEKIEQLNEINVEVERLIDDAATTELPLRKENFVEARRAQKSPEEEAKLASKYAAIESVEERAYEILMDLGMIEDSRLVDMDDVNNSFR
jgi:S-DNA-T family DNA segregation ATPase FtsK/SpoIIIE